MTTPTLPRFRYRLRHQVLGSRRRDKQVVIGSDFARDLDGDGNPDPGSGNIVKDYKDDYFDWRLGFEHDLNEVI